MFEPVRFDELFRAAVGAWGIGPTEFWQLTLREFWWLFDVRRPPPPKVGRSSFTVPEVKRLIKLQQELKAKRAAEAAEKASHGA